MADNILPHVDADSYQIPLRNLEDIHSKIMQCDALLSILVEWVCESGSSLFSHKSKNKLMYILFLLLELVQSVEKLLPEV